MYNLHSCNNSTIIFVLFVACSYAVYHSNGGLSEAEYFGYTYKIFLMGQKGKQSTEGYSNSIHSTGSDGPYADTTASDDSILISLRVLIDTHRVERFSVDVESLYL